MTRYRRVYFGHLPSDLRRSELKDAAREFGRIIDIQLHSRYGFVEFEDDRDARGTRFSCAPPFTDRVLDCVEELDGARVWGRRIQVEPAKSRRKRPEGRPGCRIIVRGLPRECSWQDLKDHMREIGSVDFADIKRSGDGIVEFAYPMDAEDAVRKFDGTELRGATIRVSLDSSDRDRSRSRSRSRSRRRSSRSPPRRRSRSMSRSVSRSPPRKERSPSPRNDRRSRSPMSQDRGRSRSPRPNGSGSPKQTGDW